MPHHLRLTIGLCFFTLTTILIIGVLNLYYLQQQIADLRLQERSILENQLLRNAGTELVERTHIATISPGRPSQLEFERIAAQAMRIAANLQTQASPEAHALSSDLASLEQVTRTVSSNDFSPASGSITAIQSRFEASLERYTSAQHRAQSAIHDAFLLPGSVINYSIIALLVSSISIAGLLSIFNSARTTPLRHIGIALEAVGQGDLDHTLPQHMPTELAPIIHGYYVMRDILRERQHALEIQLRRTSLLTQISIELRETLNPTMIAERVLRVLGSNLNIDYAIIILTTPSPNGPTRRGIRWTQEGLRPLKHGQVVQMLDYGLEGWVQQHANSTILTDVSRAERWLAGGGNAEGSAIVLALRQGEVILGSLTVYAHGTTAFTNHDLLLMEGIVAQTSVALSLGTRFQAERRQREQAMVLLEVSQFLTIERNYTDVTNLIEEQSQTLFRAEHGLLYLLAANGTIGEPVLASPIPAEIDPYTLDCATITAAEACESGQIVTKRTRQNAVQGNCVALPLINAGHTLGACVLIQAREVPASFSASTWSQLTIFTNLIASACANMGLIQQMRQHTEQLEALVERRTHELQRSRDLLRIVFDHLPEGLMLLDTQGTVLATNNAFCRGIIGRTPREIVGRSYRQIWLTLANQSELNLSPQGPSESGFPLIPTESEQFPLGFASWRVLSSDIMGQQRWYAVDRFPIAGPVGRPNQCLECWRDITHQEALQRRLLVHEQLTSLGRLAASVAHEVGNPLQSALGCLELCRGDIGLSDASREYLDLALGELDRMARTMSSLRNLYRPPQIIWEQVDLNQLLRQVGQFTQHQLERARVRLSLQLDEDLPPITGQPDALRQVFLNLVLNAQEAMAKGGQISISTKRKLTDRICQVTIRDTGIGMSADQLTHIFEPFRSMKAQGVGLGLYLSRQIIEQHTGHIDIASEPSQGTIITVQLPWSDAGPWRPRNTNRGNEG
ncbi:MAG: GAF domain-containing protein [Oscillochloris sp.]|nr:GAF domain-containing protein [Oscillochloris sp.]